jgi:hypothetical protein
LMALTASLMVVWWLRFVFAPFNNPFRRPMQKSYTILR